MRIGIIGSGIAGMTATHLLQERHEVHVFEADDRPGGHANTVTVDLPGGPVAADTGFLVYNERTYPLFTRLLADLGVATHPSEMSFSLTDLRCGLEWRGTSLSTIFAQRRNALRPAFLAMLADVVRFNRLSRALLNRAGAETGAGAGTLADLLAAHRWSTRLPRLVPDSAGVGHLVGGPRDLHADPGSNVRRVLQPPRSAGPGRPAGLAHGDRRVDPLRGDHPRAACADKAACTCATRSPRCVATNGGVELLTPQRPGDLRPRGHRHPQRPGPGPAGRPDRPRNAASSAPSAISRTGPPCTPTPRCSPPTAGPGRRGTTCARPGRPTGRRSPTT